MQRTLIARFFSQHRTPIMPQVTVSTPLDAQQKLVRVGYLLCRGQVVKHAPHPLETEYSYTVEREHQRYCRHDGSESVTHFLSSRGQTMDTANRSDAGQIMGDFYNLDLYQDAMRVVMQRFQPEKRNTDADFLRPLDPALANGPPPRLTLNRSLDDFLYLIIKHKDTGKWTIPSSLRKENESLRTAAERTVAEHNGDTFDAYFWSNAPTAVVRSVPKSGDSATEELLFMYSASYLAGRPQFEAMGAVDHAWVRRAELPQYLEQGFDHQDMLSVLMDVTLDSTFDGAASS
jgi:large subunit ribosomal protein L46